MIIQTSSRILPPGRDRIIQIHYPRMHSAQAEVYASARRFNVIVCGRRWGKTVLGIRFVTKPVIRGKPTAWFSPTYKMLSDVWREAKLMLAPITVKISEQEHRIETIGGGVLDMWSLDNPDSARGRRYARVVIDEAAMIRYLETAWTHVIRPTLADLEGDAFFTSTPKGLNYFHSLYQQADADPARWGHWRFPTGSNPFIRQNEIDEMRSLLPERVFRQEILAEFITDGAFFQNIEQAAVIEKPDKPEEHDGHYLVMGLDWALSEDYTVCTVACRECNRVVDWERFNQLDYTYQRERVVALAERWNAYVLPERNSIGEPNIEILAQRGVTILNGPDKLPGFNTSAATKPGLIQGLASALEHDGFLVPQDYAEELLSYEVETMMSGHPRFGAPSGAHDDRVISLALARLALATIPRAIF